MERLRRWGRRLSLAISLLLFAAAVSMIVVVLPFVKDDMVLDRLVIAVALDWRDFGLTAAKERLQYELDHQQIGMHVGDEHCALEEKGGNLRIVGCDWRVEIAIPGSSYRVPLQFSSKAEIGPDGELR